MSVGVGVSDLIFFVNQTLILYGQCKGAPAELQAAGRDVEQMHTALGILREAIINRESLVAKEPALALMIKHESKPLEEDLHGMNTILNDYIDKSKNMGIVGRVKYAVLDRNRLLCIQSNLTRSRTNFSLMLDLINMKAHEQHAQNDRQSIKKLEAILDKQIKETDSRKAESKAREKGDAKLEEILGILQERLPEAGKSKDQKLSLPQVLEQFERELQKAGLPRQKAEAARLNAAQAFSERPSVPIPSLLHPKPDPKEKRRTSDPSPQTGQSLHRSSGTRKASFRASNPGGLPERTKKYSILCVDGNHGIRAILAHTYLEVLRVWTANRSGRWLFRSVHSAGHLLGTKPNIALKPVAVRSINELLPENGYDFAADYPNETERIAMRMKSYNSHGLTTTEVASCNIILCFTRSDANSVIKLQGGSEDPARIILLDECRDISTEDCAKDPRKIKELISYIKVAIKRFIAEELGDWTDSLKRTRHYRTFELVLPSKDVDRVRNSVSPTGVTKIQEVANKNGCAINWAHYTGPAKESLVSIIGPKENLSEVVTLIRSVTNATSPLNN